MEFDGPLRGLHGEVGKHVAQIQRHCEISGKPRTHTNTRRPFLPCLAALHAKNPSPCGPLFIRAPPQHVVMTPYNLTFFMPLPTHVLRDRFPRGSTCNSDHENTIRLLESNRFSTYPTVMSEIICNTSRANRGCMHAQASSPTPFKVPLVT